MNNTGIRKKLAGLLAGFLSLAMVLAMAPAGDLYSFAASDDAIDYSDSPYKHVNNGGITGQDGPYNIDAITGATLTIEGPGVKTSVPLSVRDMESRDTGYSRAVYKDSRGGKETSMMYEGMDLYYLLNEMSSGSSGIVLTDTAKKVTIKNRNRQAISTFDLEDVTKAHNDGRPILIAYGTAGADGSSPAPFVFDGATGIIPGLGNDDGCLKLVYDTSKYGSNTGYTRFSNMAYVYVEEGERPGFKHTVEGSPYNAVENTQAIISVTGDKLGREVNYTIEEIENMVEYDSSGGVIDNGYGYRDNYSLTNTTYWYVNEYEGVRLWSLLLRSGLDPGLSSDSSTVVNYLTSDNYSGTDKFTLRQIADENAFGFYEKNSNDTNDGKYVPNENIRQGDDVNTGDKLAVGYPVLLAYGVNGYPYVISSKLDGYLSGLSNDGGPVRVISGKTAYNHNNGSSQAQKLSGIVVGENTYHYATHKYHSDKVYKDLAGSALKVDINTTVGGSTKSRTQNYTVGDIEEIIYGGDLTATQLGEAMIKAKYDSGSGSDVYEGVSIAYFLQNVVEMSGIAGTIKFTGSDGKILEASLADILSMEDGYNDDTGVSGLLPVLAYGKNGMPLAKGKDASGGYVSTVSLAAGTQFENEVFIDNQGGPLQVIIPGSKDGSRSAQTLSDVVSITVDLEPDNYAHIESPYDSYESSEITISGEGTNLTGPKIFKLSELESKQTFAGTYDYSLRKNSGDTSSIRFRGIRLYDFLKSSNVGLKPNADKVIITCRDGSNMEFSMDAIIRKNYVNTADSTVTELPPILAYGSAAVSNPDKKDGKPLVTGKDSVGYADSYLNSGGPVRFVIGQKYADDANAGSCLSDVVSIEVTASEMINWNHSSSATFETYLDRKVTFEAVDPDNNVVFSREMTVLELESMKDLVTQQELHLKVDNVWEGLNLWNLLTTVMDGVDGLSDPVAINVIAMDGFAYNVMEQGLDAIKNGVKDGGSYYPIMLAYGCDGVPLAQFGKNDEAGPGYDSSIDNGNGPIRLVIQNANGKSAGNVVKVQVKVKSGPVKFDVFPGTSKDGQLPMAGIRSTAMDKDGNLWVGTYGGGAAYRAKGSDKFVVYNKASKPALETTFVSAIYPDNKGGVYMSQNASYTNPSDNRGLAYMKGGKIKLYRAPKTVPDDYVQEVKVDSSGIVWIGSFGGLTKFDPKAGKWKTWNTSNGFPAKSVDNIEMDSKGGIWCGFYPGSEADDGSKPFKGGFAYFKDGKVANVYKYTSPKDANTGAYRLGDVWIRDIAVDKNGGAWIVASGSYAGMANTGGKVWYVSSPGAKAKEFTGFELFGEKAFTQDSELRMVTVDPDGGLWFGTSKDGVFYCEDPDISSGKLALTAQYSSSKGSWDEGYDNIYSLDFHGSTLYAGSSGGLATHKFTFNNDGRKDISKSKVVLSYTAYTYNKKVHKPKVVSIGGKKLKKGVDYTVKYSKASPKNVGRYSVTVTGIGKYKGKVKVSYRIRPKGTSIKKLTKARKAFTVKWKKQSAKMPKYRITGYQIQISTDKKFTKNKKTFNVKGYRKTSKKITKLKAGKKYYVRVRTYRTASGKKNYSKWSKIKTVKTR